MSIKSGRDLRPSANEELRFAPHDPPANTVHQVDPAVAARFMAQMRPVASTGTPVAAPGGGATDSPPPVASVQRKAGSKKRPGRVAEQITDEIVAGWYAALRAGRTTREAIAEGPIDCDWGTARRYLLERGYDLSFIYGGRAREKNQAVPAPSNGAPSPALVPQARPPVLHANPVTAQTLGPLQGLLSALQVEGAQVSGTVSIQLEITLNIGGGQS